MYKTCEKRKCSSFLSPGEVEVMVVPENPRLQSQLCKAGPGPASVLSWLWMQSSHPVLALNSSTSPNRKLKSVTINKPFRTHSEWEIHRKLQWLIKDCVLGLAIAERCRTSVYWHAGLPAFLISWDFPPSLLLNSSCKKIISLHIMQFWEIKGLTLASCDPVH